MLERSEASKISKPVISTTARRRNLKNYEIVIPVVGAVPTCPPKSDKGFQNNSLSWWSEVNQRSTPEGAVVGAVPTCPPKKRLPEPYISVIFWNNLSPY